MSNEMKNDNFLDLAEITYLTAENSRFYRTKNGFPALEAVLPKFGDDLEANEDKTPIKQDLGRFDLSSIEHASTAGEALNPEVFRQFEAEHIIVLPNNSNVILTAKQAAEAYQDCDVHVIPTKSVVEGYSALSMMNPWCDTVEEFIEEMSMSLPGVTTGYVTTAIRDAYMDGVDVKKGDYIGLADHHILTDNADRISAAKTVIKKITDESEKGVIIVFYGAEVPDEEAAALEE